MPLSRREFLSLAAAGGVATLASKRGNTSEPSTGETYGVLVDTTVCVGCRSCEWACNEEHKLTDKPRAFFEDKSVFKEHRRPDRDSFNVVNEFRDPKNPSRPYWMKVQCMHCLTPACVSACLVGALKKRSNGAVTYDSWKCMGCRYCMVACPFQIPAYEYDNPLNPKVKKCDFCFDRVFVKGGRPACVDICPEEVFTFGKRSDLIIMAKRLIKNYPDRYVNQVYGESEVGGTNWLYLASTDFVNTELPKLMKKPVPELTEKIQHGIFKYFIPPVALYGLLALIMNSFKDKQKQKEFK